LDGEVSPLDEENLKFDRLEYFVPLCGSCHGKVGRCEGFYWLAFKEGGVPPFIKALRDVVESKKPKGGNGLTLLEGV
jgi:hypothetical protein